MMSTRAAAKREAALLHGALIASKTLSFPPYTPGDTKTTTGPIIGHQGALATIVDSNESSTDLSLFTSRKRKRTTTKGKKILESVKIELDVLPHGLGKKGDLLSDAVVENLTFGKTPLSKAPTGDTPTEKSNGHVKLEDQTDVKHLPTPKSARSNKLDPVTVELLEESLPRKRRGRGRLVKPEEDGTDAKDGNFEHRPKKKSALSRKKTLSVSEDVLDKVNDLVNAAEQPSKKRQKTANKYGLTPGKTPFSHHTKPTPDDAEEVNRLLSALHGEVKPPEVIPPPSMEVTGCGEVPDLLDAILRTLLSAATTANNSNLSLQGLKEKFHLRESGIGKGSVNWEAVHKADLSEVIDAIKSGGLAKVKATNIKKILDVVYDQNCVRRDALLEEKETGKPANTPGAKNMTKEQKDIEIARVTENMLSMDHVFEMTTDEAMDEMTKLPGIGVKTASCVILFCMKRPSFAVDTHVWRHCKWLGWVPETATRDQTFSHCEVRVPDHLKYSLHQLFLKHGKTCGRCRANTSAGTEEWNNTDCPIDHLVNRTEKKKLPGNSSAVKAKPANKKKGPKKGKMQDGETEESDDVMNGESDGSGSEYGG